MSPAIRSRRIMSKLAKLGLAAVLAVLLLAAFCTSLLIAQRQAALREISRYNITWLVSQAALEVARLHGAIGAALTPGSGVDEDEIDLRLDIVANRVRLLENGEVAEFVGTSPDLVALVQQFHSVAAQARAELGRPDARSRWPEIATLVDGLQPSMAHLASAAYAHGGKLVTQDQQQLSVLFRTFAVILGATTLCGFGLVSALVRRNRLLAQAQDEVGQQNDMLRLRDAELNTQNARFDAALNNMSHALCMVGADQRLIVCNVRFPDLFGLDPASVKPGALASDIFKSIASAGRYDPQMVEAVFARQARHAGTRQSSAFAEQDRAGRALAVSQEPMDGGGWVATFEDITDRRRIEARISFMAHHDALTGLPNRTSLNSRLEDALMRYGSAGESVAILCLDLDRFKQVNDTLGHPAGDSLLRAVAARLQTCVREGDLVVRLGGDEFAILQTAARQPAASETLARRIVEELGRPYDIEGHRVVVGASIGIAVAALNSTRADTLLKNADIALYCAKADGRGTFRMFEATMDTQVQARRAIESDLREALGRGELELFYQPLCNVAANRVCGFEALLRWRHPARGLVSPAVFVPIAEELGLIMPIGEWVLAQACADAAQWPDGLKVAVNLSPVQFRSPDLVAAVQRALLTSGLPACRLELEITESALLQDSQTVLNMLHRMGELGLRIALDDFGTGYSSLSYLRSFPFSKLKIDQSFIKDIARRSDCEAIVRSVASLAQTLGMTTTAEGVETEEQLRRLCDAGCTEAQGYLFDEPRPVADIGRWFQPSLAPAVPSRQAKPAALLSL